MVIIHCPIRQSKETLEYKQSYDEIKQQQRIIGRRVLSTKKLVISIKFFLHQSISFPLSTMTYSLYSSSDSNYNMNFNEISRSSIFPSLITKTQKTNKDEHDLEQSKLKNMVINELKSVFASRNQKQYDAETNIQFQTSISTPKYFIQQRKQTIINNGNQ